MSFIRNAKVGDWVHFSRSVSFDGPFFTLKSGSVTECNLHGRHKKGRGGGWYSPVKVTGCSSENFENTPYRVPESCFMVMFVADNFLTRLIFIFLFFFEN